MILPWFHDILTSGTTTKQKANLKHKQDNVTTIMNEPLQQVILPKMLIAVKIID